MEKFSNAFDFLECKHNLRLPCKEEPLFCYSEPWPLIVVAGTKEEEKGNIFLKSDRGGAQRMVKKGQDFA